MTTYKGNSWHGGTKSKQRVTVLLGCNADGTEKLPPLVIGKYNKPHCIGNVRKLPTKCTANSNSWMTDCTWVRGLSAPIAPRPCYVDPLCPKYIQTSPMALLKFQMAPKLIL